MSDKQVERERFQAVMESKPDAKYGSDGYNAWVADVREALEALVGQTWDTQEVQRDFIIDSFAYYIAFGRRKSDGVKVSLDFLHSPRFYHSVREA